MSTFPTLTPSGRTFTPGEYPQTPFQVYSGYETRVRHSNVMLSSQLRLTFTALTEADMLSILSHYNGEYGTFQSFTLPSAVWAGAVQADYELTNYRWRYIESPAVEDVYCDRYTVELVIETVPPDGTAAGGAVLSFQFSVEGTGAFTANGLAKTVAMSFAAAGAGAAGADLTVAYTLGSAGSFALAATATFAPGVAGQDAAATDEGAFWNTTYWQDTEPLLFSEGIAVEDDGFASPLYWTQDLFTDWR